MLVLTLQTCFATHRKASVYGSGIGSTSGIGSSGVGGSVFFGSVPIVACCQFSGVGQCIVNCQVDVRTSAHG